MKQSFLLSIFLAASLSVYSQTAGTGSFDVVEYMPAPGQHINIESIGTPDAAAALAEDPATLVSLGSFGGYVVLAFKEECLNHPDNPYGIDFTVFGNAFAGSSEPGVIWVMKDENGNGLPDDIWYEIAGSHHFHSGTIGDYRVTYLKTSTRDVSWHDNKNGSGILKANQFNLQEYYPSPEYFPDYPKDSVIFSGTLLSGLIDSSNLATIKTIAPVFGYADSHSMIQGISLKLPDNPYTFAVEGAGGDPVDISWAVDSDGNYVDLDYVNFVKVTSGIMASAGWLGEISTDLSWIEDVNPLAGISGKQNILVVYPYHERIIAGGQMQLEACWFENGRKKSREMSYFSDNESVLEIDSTGLITAVSKGKAGISIFTGDTTYTADINVVVPDSIKIKSDFSGLFPGDTVLLSAEVFDNLGFILDIPVIFESSDSLVAKIVKTGDSYLLNALQPGEAVIRCFVEDSSFEQLVQARVLSPGDKIKVYMSVKTENENLLPFQWIETGNADLNGVVQDRNQDYSQADRITLFHALVSGLQKAETGYSFRDDENAGEKLYLYSVESDDIFTYGWGGKTAPEAFARAWIARLNGSHYLNSFDEIPISDGDTVDLYHIYNITNPWLYRRLLAGKDNASENEEIELLLEEADCKYEDGVITESAFSPVVNEEISAGGSLYTGDDGTVWFVAGSTLPVVVSSGNNAVLILKRVTTGIADTYSFSGRFVVYPNPFGDELTVKGQGTEGFTVMLTDQSGRILIRERSPSDLYTLRSGSFPAGTYMLVILSENGSETFKLIKR